VRIYHVVVAVVMIEDLFTAKGREGGGGEGRGGKGAEKHL
jgi:hypothetical protein